MDTFEYNGKKYGSIRVIDSEPNEVIKLSPGKWILAMQEPEKTFPELINGDVIVTEFARKVVLNAEAHRAVTCLTGEKSYYMLPIDDCMILRDGNIIWNSRQADGNV